MRLAKVLGGFGRVLIWTGVIILLFVAYQLWGTNLAEARAQDDLESEFEELLVEAPEPDEPTSTSAPEDDSETDTTTTAPEGLFEIPEPGQAMARIEIPEIGVDKIVVEGVSRSDLKKGPGHYPDTPFPGQSGNAAIAGHRTTYGAPFHRIDELGVDDEITVTTLQGRFTYQVIGQEIVTPSDIHVIDDMDDDRLTLTSCHPKYSARQRIIVSAVLVDEPAPPTPRGTREIDQAIETLDGEETGPVAPVIIFGLIALAVWLFFYVLSRKWRRWPAYALGVAPFGVALFVWFGAVAELLPSNF
ncbi:MAG: class E sortase [Acidimicrobiales bacterium]|nr:class E sortase [Acidimicrobiales bacterium]